jgi:endonuclease/exonuclease/phosphatase family metal-dependent hydrolase
MSDTTKFSRRAAIGGGLSLLAAGGAALTATPAAAATTVRVMSWNIHGEGVNLAGIASVIKQYGVDVATLQEVHRREDQDQVAVLASSLGLHISDNVHFGQADLVGPCDAPWTGSRAGWAGNAVFSRFPIVERVTKALSPASQNCPVKRAMSGVRLNVAGKTLRVFTTHFTPGASAAALDLRHAQTTTVVNYLTQSGPLLLTGDLNDTPVSWVRNRVVDAGFVDAGARYADDPTLGTARIDYIFYRGTTVTGGFVPSPGYSDHRPVIMDVVV